MSDSPPPGWYPDPSGITRYWTGTQWGPAQTPDAQSATPRLDSSTPQPALGGEASRRMGSEFIDKSSMGLIAVVCGIPVYFFAGLLGALTVSTPARWSAS
jgi:hypothetical protein